MIKYCVLVYEKQYGLLVKQYFVDSKEEAVEIHQKYTKKGHHAVIEENPSDPELNWRLMQA